MEKGEEKPKENPKEEQKNSNIIKQTTIEEVQVITQERPKPAPKPITEPQVEAVQQTGTVIDPPRDIDPVYYTLDFNNKEMLDKALALITNTEAREATIAEINDYLNNPEYAQYHSTLEENIRKVLILRAENKYINNVAAIAQMDEAQCYEKSLEIAAVMPLYASKEQESVHKLILPLLLRNSPTETYTTLRTLLTYITYIAPLRQRVDTMATIMVKEGRSVEPELQDTFNIFKIPNRSKGESEKEREIFDLSTLLAYSEIMEVGEYCEQNAHHWFLQLRGKLSVEDTQKLVTNIVKSCIATATARVCFDVEIMRKCRAILESLNNYLKTQNDVNYAQLVGCVCLLPVLFMPTGQMDLPWASALALIVPTALNQLISIAASNLTSFLIYAYSTQTVEEAKLEKKTPTANKGLMNPSSSSSSDDEEPEIIYQDVIEEEEVGEPEKIEDVEEITIEEEEEDNGEDEAMNSQFMEARTLESVRNALHLLKQFNDAALNLEPQLVNARFETLYLCMYDLIKIVPQEECERLTQILQQITSIAKQIVGYNDRSSASQIETGIDYLKQLKHTLTGKNSSAVVISELVLLSSYSDQLYTRVEHDPSTIELEMLDPFKKQIVIESKEVLKSIKLLSRKSIKLMQQITDLPHTKPLIKAISQTSESSQLFYLYIRNTEQDDDAFKTNVSNGCRKMESALSCMVMLFPKTLPDEYNEIRSINGDISSRLENMIDLSENVKGFVGKGGPNDLSASSLTEKRLDAEALVIKRRKELADAEAEVQRLKEP